MTSTLQLPAFIRTLTRVRQAWGEKKPPRIALEDNIDSWKLQLGLLFICICVRVDTKQWQKRFRDPKTASIFSLSPPSKIDFTELGKKRDAL